MLCTSIMYDFMSRVLHEWQEATRRGAHPCELERAVDLRLAELVPLGERRGARDHVAPDEQQQAPSDRRHQTQTFGRAAQRLRQRERVASWNIAVAHL